MKLLNMSPKFLNIQMSLTINMHLLKVKNILKITILVTKRKTLIFINLIMIWKKRQSKILAMFHKNQQGCQTCNIHSLNLWKPMISLIPTNQFVSQKINISTINKAIEKIWSHKNIRLKKLTLWECWKKSIKMEEINI